MKINNFYQLICLLLLTLSTELRARPLVDPNGGYPKKDLVSDKVVLKVVQTNAESIQVADRDSALKRNIDNMILFGKKACTTGKKPNILLFHEFPLTGWFSGNRSEKLKNSIFIPGKETDEIAKLAKFCDSYIVFGAYVQDSNWPGHVLSINTVINRNGKIVKKFWKPKNIKRFYDTFEINTTTVENVRDRFRSKYGIEDEFPVLKTEFGNIAVSTVQLDPFVFAAFAMKGVEIMLRTATLFFRADVIATAQTNNFFSAMANIPYNSPYGGKSIIVSPDGDVLAEHPDNNTEGIITAELDMASFRKNRKIPQYSTELTKPVFDQYQQEIPLNHLDLPQNQLPQNGGAMKKLLDSLSRWQ